jgi:DNA-binding response OmpR family regulator
MARILIVDDEATFRSVVAVALRQHGHQVIEAEDGRSGLVQLNAHEVDLVITDVLMPEQDGLELIMKVRDGANPVPVIAMTGHPAKGDLYLKLAKALGAQRALAKPFNMDDLLGAVRELLSKTERN